MNPISQFTASFFSFLRRNLKSLLCILAGVLLLSFSILLFSHTPDRRLDRLLDTYLREELSQDGLTLHYMLANPDAYSVKDASHTFKIYKSESRNEAEASTERMLTLLSQITPDTLSPSSRITFEIMLDALLTEQEGYRYFYYEEPLTFSSGMHVQVPILLSEYAFRNAEDVENYLTLLASYPDYLNGLLLFEQEKAANGLFMSKYALKEVLKQCRDLITTETLEENRHFLQTTFEKRLLALREAGLLTEEACASYREKNNRLLKEAVLPAYTSLADGLQALEAQAGRSAGLSSKENGTAYYEYLVRKMTGSDHTVPELMDALQQSFLADCKQLDTLLPALEGKTYDFSLAGRLESPQEITQDLMTKTEVLFPIPQGENSIRILSVEKALEDYVSPAFYLTPALDAYNEHVIYINEGNRPDDLTLYTTLAHEGYPGHLYQTLCFYRTIDNGALHPVRALLHYPGYTEGYATYAEFLSYEYAKSHGNSAMLDCELPAYRLQLTLYAMLDICIHYYGYDNEDTYDCLVSFGLDDRRLAGELYEYIVNAPANYLSYRVGYMEVLECRELAEVCWKDAYSLQNFHRFFLTYGPAPFPFIKEQIRAVDPDLIQKSYD